MKLTLKLLALSAIVATAAMIGCEGAKDAANDAKDAAGTAVETGKDAAGKAVEKGADVAKGAVDTAANAAAEAGKTLKENIENALKGDLADAAKTLKVEMNGKEIVVSGTVKDEAMKTKVQEILDKVPPVAGFTVKQNVTVGG
ncbi:MAG: hypothetical protein JNM04_06730 [Chthonomonas sp.]|nr:hypothetical protein [Chthonomonas sp.]